LLKTMSSQYDWVRAEITGTKSHHATV
jgi:hypothetical protein